MKNLNRSFFWIILLLVFAVAGRASFIEYADLTDPTEARYASVAQQMVISGNWVTPMMPMPNGIEPYLGKPPLYFWLTAISYKIFGVDEWSSRLPCVLATIMILCAVFLFTRNRFGKIHALAASLILTTSAVPFFLSGISATDIILSALVTMGTMFLYLFITSENSAKYFFMLSALFAGLAFLTKGPVSLVLIGFPLLLWSSLRRDFSWISKAPWLSAMGVFILVVFPWFITNEFYNPGFLKYFFWNENIARYLFKEYGDKYGSGHVHPYGSSWYFLALAFLPWTFVLIFPLFKSLRQKLFSVLKNDSNLTFVLCWAISTPLFFTFVRQLHILYILPAIPPLSIFASVMLAQSADRFSVVKEFIVSNKPIYLYLFFSLLVAVVGASLSFSYFAFLTSLVFILATFSLFKFIKVKEPQLAVLTRTALFLIGMYLVVLGSVTPLLNETLSASEILRQVARDEGCYDGENSNLIGISTQNTFSHYWTSKTSEEIDPLEELKVEYVLPADVFESDVCRYLVEKKFVKNLPQSVTDNFTLEDQLGNWLVYIRNASKKP
jgi:4-amino-4-deoxy-L-arabinose transferase-like glycosyltransferase